MTIETQQKYDKLKRVKLKPFFELFSAKNIKDNVGHDTNGCFYDIHMKRKKVGHFNDDGWGGEVDIQLTTEARTVLSDMCVNHKIADFMYNEVGWNFYDNVEKITIDVQIEFILEYLLQEHYWVKAEKKAQKDMEKYILYAPNGDYFFGYKMFGWKKITLQEVVNMKGAKWVENEIKNNLIPKFQNNEIIVNTNLKQLGIEL